MVQNETVDPIIRRLEVLEHQAESLTNHRIPKSQDSEVKETSYTRSDRRDNINVPKKRQAGVCNGCGSPDHYKRECPRLKDPQNHPYNKYHNHQYRATNNQYYSRVPEQTQRHSNQSSRPARNQGNCY